VLDCFFNLTNKSNLINIIFDNLVVAYFLAALYNFFSLPSLDE